MARTGGIFGSGELPDSTFEPAPEQQHDGMSCAPAAASIALQWAAMDRNLWSPEVQDALRAVLRPLERGGVTFRDLVRALLAQRWPLKLEVGILRYAGSLASVRLPIGTALVVGLDARPGEVAGHAVAIVHRQPGMIVDPADGLAVAPTAAHEARWARGRRLVTALRCL